VYFLQWVVERDAQDHADPTHPLTPLQMSHHLDTGTAPCAPRPFFFLFRIKAGVASCQAEFVEIFDDAVLALFP